MKEKKTLKDPEFKKAMAKVQLIEQLNAEHKITDDDAEKAINGIMHELSRFYSVVKVTINEK